MKKLKSLILLGLLMTTQSVLAASKGEFLAGRWKGKIEGVRNFENLNGVNVSCNADISITAQDINNRNGTYKETRVRFLVKEVKNKADIPCQNSHPSRASWSQPINLGVINSVTFKIRGTTITTSIPLGPTLRNAVEYDGDQIDKIDADVDYMGFKINMFARVIDQETIEFGFENDQFEGTRGYLKRVNN